MVAQLIWRFTVLKAEGFITEIDDKKKLVKVCFPQHDDVESDWLQTLSIGGGKSYFNYDIDTYVACIMDARLEDGWVLGTLESEDADFLETGKDIYVREFSDGTVIKYDRSASKMEIECKGDVSVNAAGKAVIKAATIELDGGAGAQQGVLHAFSFCPVLNVCHMQPSQTVKISL